MNFSKLLRRVVLVNPEEIPALLWSAAYFFFLLSSYYILRPVRETMGIDRGADKLAWLMTGTMAAMFLVNPLFSWLVSRTPRRRFIPVTYHVCAATMVVFWAVMEYASKGFLPYVGYAFYIWTSVFNLFAVSVFWSVLADGFTTEQGKRLFGFVGVLGTLGGVFGPALTARLATHIGPFRMLLISAVLLELAILCANRLIRTFGFRRATGMARSTGSTGEPGRGVLSGVLLVARSPYLLLVSLYLFSYTVLNTFLYMEQGRIVEAALPDRAARTVAFAHMDSWANILTVTMQVLVAGRMMRRLGVGVTLAILPAISAIGFCIMWRVSGNAERAMGTAAQGAALQLMLHTLMAFQVTRRGLHYAVSQPARQVLFTGLGPDEIYKSKPFIDTFVYRGGDLAGTWSWRGLIALAKALGRGAAGPVAAAAIPVSLLSLAVGLMLGVAQRRRIAARTKPVAEGAAVPVGDPAVARP